MARARGEHEALHRPCLQKQSRQKRTHRQPQLRFRLQRHRRPYFAAPRSIGLSRVPARSMRRGGLPFGTFWQVALWMLCHRIESSLAGRATSRERDVDANLSLPRLGPRPPTDPRRTVITESDAPDANENTRDTLHGLLLAPLTVAVRTVPIPRRRRRDLPQLWRRQRRDEVRPTDVRVPPVVGNARPVGAGAP